MFARLNLQLNNDDITLDKVSYICVTQQQKACERIVRSVLDKYLSKDGYLDASVIEKDWFPDLKAHVFLSHSHRDVDLAIRLAGYLRAKFGIETFIDSAVWGYANELLKHIDEVYCVHSKKPNGGFVYDYELRNLSTAHVHLILQGALAKMINCCEALVFLNTPNSLLVSDICDLTEIASPWIYSELLMANTFPIRDLSYYREQKNIRTKDVFAHSDLRIKYKVNLTDFVNVELEDFRVAAAKTSIKTACNILDQLYLDKGLII